MTRVIFSDHLFVESATRPRTCARCGRGRAHQLHRHHLRLLDRARRLDGAPAAASTVPGRDARPAGGAREAA